MSQWDQYLDRLKADVIIIIGTYASTSNSLLNYTNEALILTVLSCSLLHIVFLLLTWLLYVYWYCRLDTSGSAMATVSEVYQKLCSIWIQWIELTITVWVGNLYKSETNKAHTYFVKQSITLIKSSLWCWEPMYAHIALTMISSMTQGCLLTSTKAVSFLFWDL